MNKLTNFHLKSILNKKVYDEFNEVIGYLIDIYVSTDEGYPRAIGYKIKNEREVVNCEFKSIDFYGTVDKIEIKIKSAREIIPRSYTYLLYKNLLNRKIVDLNGKKVVHVDDLSLAIIAGEIRVLAVESGIDSKVRGKKVRKLYSWIYKLFSENKKDNIVLWDSVESLEIGEGGLKVAYAYDKLKNLHPADLADILEDLDSDYRNRILENLDIDFASDILEEIEPEIQVDILKNIDDVKAQEILEIMPNDEIADILEEVDEETAEEILMGFEKEDQEEVRSLMRYEDDVIGSIMNKDFIAFNMDLKVSEVIEILKGSNPEEEVCYFIFIIDEYGRLLGEVSLRELILTSKECNIKEIMNKDIRIAKDTDSIDVAIELVIKYSMNTLPIVDESERLCGIVIVNDIVEEVLSSSWRKKLKRTAQA